MRLTINLSKVELKKSKDAVTRKMGLSWMTHCIDDFGFKKIVSDGYSKKLNREKDRFEKDY